MKARQHGTCCQKQRWMICVFVTVLSSMLAQGLAFSHAFGSGVRTQQGFMVARPAHHTWTKRRSDKTCVQVLPGGSIESLSFVADALDHPPALYLAADLSDIYDAVGFVLNAVGWALAVCLYVVLATGNDSAQSGSKVVAEKQRQQRGEEPYCATVHSKSALATETASNRFVADAADESSSLEVATTIRTGKSKVAEMKRFLATLPEPAPEPSGSENGAASARLAALQSLRKKADLLQAKETGEPSTELLKRGQTEAKSSAPLQSEPQWLSSMAPSVSPEDESRGAASVGCLPIASWIPWSWMGLGGPHTSKSSGAVSNSFAVEAEPNTLQPGAAFDGRQVTISATSIDKSDSSDDRVSWLTATKELWQRAKRAVSANSSYLANAVVLTGLTGGVLSTTVRPLGAGGLLHNARIEARDHTVVLSDHVDSKLFSVLRGMSHEAESGDGPASTLRRGPVVVLTPHDRVKTQAAIETDLAEDRGWKIKMGGGAPINVVTRQGDPGTMEDLNLVRIQDAKHVVWVKGDDAASSPHRHLSGPVPVRQRTETEDASDLAAVMAERHTAREAALLSELRSARTSTEQRSDATQLQAPVVLVSGRQHADSPLNRLGNDHPFVRIDELEVSEKILQRSAAQPGAGLARGLNQLLGASQISPLHSEPVSQTFPWLMGKAFSEAQASFPHSVVCGLIRNNEVLLSPPPDTWISPFDRLVVLGSGKTGMRAVEHGARNTIVDEGAGNGGKAEAFSQAVERPQHILLLNWNDRGGSVLDELRLVATPSGSVTVMSGANTKDIVSSVHGCYHAGHGRARVEVFEGDTVNAQHLRAIKANRCNVIVVLPETDREGHANSASDASLLATVQELERLEWSASSRVSDTRPRLVGMVHSEAMETRLRQACDRAGLGSDFVLSDRVEGGVATKVMLRPAIKPVISALVDKATLVPMQDALGNASEFEGTFAELQQQVAANGLLALGIARADGAVAVNTRAAEQVSLSRQDLVLVLPRLEDEELCKA